MTTPGPGGAEFAAVEMLDALVDRGHDAVLVTDEPAIARDTRVAVRPISMGPKLSKRSWPRLMIGWLPYVRRLRQALEREWPYDVLLLHYKKEQLMARQLPARLRATLVWAEWGPVPYPLRRGLPRRLYVDAASHAGKVMAASTGTMASVSSLGVPEQKIEVMPNAMRVDEIRFTPEGRARMRRQLGIEQDAFVVGCVSRFHPKKRNDVVVDAVRELDSGVHLVLAGDGETADELRARAAPLGDRAHFLPTPREEVADVLSAFDVSVFCPSPTEGAPRSVILAMLAERPCLATGPEGVAETVTEDVGAIISPENDPRALAACIRGYLDDPDLRARQGSEARRRAEATYAFPVVAERIERLFQAAGAA